VRANGLDPFATHRAAERNERMANADAKPIPRRGRDRRRAKSLLSIPDRTVEIDRMQRHHSITFPSSDVCHVFD
jgi:hypothetical protein